MTSYASFAIEAVHFDISDVIRRARGHDGNYLGVQFAFDGKDSARHAVPSPVCLLRAAWFMENAARDVARTFRGRSFNTRFVNASPIPQRQTRCGAAKAYIARWNATQPKTAVRFHQFEIASALTPRRLEKFPPRDAI